MRNRISSLQIYMFYHRLLWLLVVSAGRLGRSDLKIAGNISNIYSVHITSEKKQSRIDSLKGEFLCEK